MAKNAALNPLERIVVVGGILAAVNWMAARYLGFPFAYCWLAPVVAPIYLSWGTALLYVAALYGGLQLLRRRTAEAFLAAITFVLIIEFPGLTDAVFMPGGSCGR